MKVRFSTKAASHVVIDIDEDNYSATVTTLTGQQIGSIDFTLIEAPDAPDGYYLKMTHAFLEGANGKYLHEGIGTECVRLMGKVTGFPITASDDDGAVHEDGSHLTGDAPGWVAKLRQRKLVF
ncbi:MAG: hypothetical protein AAGK92_13550 [Pseudomonadota bacterium]